MWPLLLAVFFAILALVWLAVGLALKFWEAQRRKRVGEMLETVSGKQPNSSAVELVRSDAGRDALSAALGRSGLFRHTEQRLRQADLDWSLGQFFIVSVVAAAVGALIGMRFQVLVLPLPSIVGMACVFGLLPYLFASRRRTTRLRQFERQFPEALDFLARAMRAGHAFSASLELLASESAPPLGPEFRKVYDEQNLGAPLEVALRKLAARVPLIDVRFFVSAVMLQRDTGGNLGEILRNLARVIRERFQLKGQVRAMSAHGRITATVLTALPLVTMLLLTVLAPSYLKGLADDSDGKYLIIASLLGQGLGYYCMRKIIRIKI